MEKINFEINGNDLGKLRKFQNQHKSCDSGFAGDKYSYTFSPSGLGTAITVQCSCGQKLLLGDIADSKEYDAEECKVLTEEDRKNEIFEDAARAILQMKNPRIFRMMFQTDQTFELVFCISCVIAAYTDTRIGNCILPKRCNESFAEFCKDLSDSEKIEKFYEYFEQHLKVELEKFHCANKLLLRMLYDEA